MTCILSFCIIMPCWEPSLCTWSVGSFPVWSGGFLTIFPVPLAVGNLALNKENVLHIRFWLIGQGYERMVCLSVCPYMSVHSYICQDIHTSIDTFIHVSTIISIILGLHQCQIAWETSSNMIWWMPGNTRCCRFSLTGWTFSPQMYSQTC